MLAADGYGVAMIEATETTHYPSCWSLLFDNSLRLDAAANVSDKVKIVTEQNALKIAVATWVRSS
jgi:hypothetical protein